MAKRKPPSRKKAESGEHPSALRSPPSALRQPELITKSALAEHFGVDVKSITNWQQEPDFPPRAGTTSKPLYDLIQIEAWHAARGKKTAIDTATAQQVSLQLKIEQLKHKQIETRRLERQQEIEAGMWLPAAEYEQYQRDVITLTRDALMGIPKELANMLPKKMQTKFLTEGERRIRAILDQFAELVSGTPHE